MNNQISKLLIIVSVVLLLMGGASANVTASQGSYAIQVNCSPQAIIAFFLVLFVLFRTYRVKQAEIDLSQPIKFLKRVLSFIMDFFIYLTLVVVPFSLLALWIESSRTKQFQWSFERNQRYPSDTMLEIGIVIITLLLIIIMIMRKKQKIVTLGQIFFYPKKNNTASGLNKVSIKQ